MFFINGRSGATQWSTSRKDVQRYDIQTNTFALMAASPVARGGLGNAVFMQGFIYLMGGETSASGASASAGRNSLGTFYRCDVYKVLRDQWNVDSSGAPLPLVAQQASGGGCPDLPTGMHGIYPVLQGFGVNRILISGGGLNHGVSSSGLVLALA